MFPAPVQSPVISTTHVSPFSLQGHHHPCLALIPATHWPSGGCGVRQTPQHTWHGCPWSPTWKGQGGRSVSSGLATVILTVNSPVTLSCMENGRLWESLGVAPFRGWVRVRSRSPVWLLSPQCVLTTHQWLPNIDFSSSAIFSKLDFGHVLSHVKLTQQRGSARNQGTLSLCPPTARQPPPQVTRGS